MLDSKAAARSLVPVRMDRLVAGVERTGLAVAIVVLAVRPLVRTLPVEYRECGASLSVAHHFRLGPRIGLSLAHWNQLARDRLVARTSVGSGLVERYSWVARSSQKTILARGLIGAGSRPTSRVGFGVSFGRGYRCSFRVNRATISLRYVQ